MSDLHRDIAVVTSDHCYEIRQLHAKDSTGQSCAHCRHPYPCPTVQILNRTPRPTEDGAA